MAHGRKPADTSFANSVAEGWSRFAASTLTMFATLLEDPPAANNPPDAAAPKPATTDSTGNLAPKPIKMEMPVINENYLRKPSSQQPLEAKRATDYYMETLSPEKSTNKLEIYIDKKTHQRYIFKSPFSRDMSSAEIIKHRSRFMPGLEAGAWARYHYFSPDIVAKDVHTVCYIDDHNIIYTGSIATPIGEEIIPYHELPEQIKEKVISQLSKKTQDTIRNRFLEKIPLEAQKKLSQALGVPITSLPLYELSEKINKEFINQLSQANLLKISDDNELADKLRQENQEFLHIVSDAIDIMSKSIQTETSAAAPHNISITSLSLADRPLTEEDLKDDLIVQDYTDILSLSQMWHEEDLHKGNILWYKKDGRWRLARIDFDMSRWPIQYLYKDFNTTNFGLVGNFFNEQYRTTWILAFSISVEMFENFPDYSGSAYTFWLTKPGIILSYLNRAALSNSGTASKPGKDKYWTEEDARIGKLMVHDPRVIHRKCVNALQLVLTDPAHFDKLDNLQTWQNTPDLGKYGEEHHKKYKEMLLSSKQFKEFLNDELFKGTDFKKTAQDALNTVLERIQAQNARYLAKANENNDEHYEYKELIVDLEVIKKRYDQLYHMVMSQHAKASNEGNKTAEQAENPHAADGAPTESSALRM